MKKIISILFFFPLVISAQQLKVDTNTSYITYEASHPIHDWSGTSKDVQGVLVLEKDIPRRIAVITPVSSFDSKNSNRDGHAVEVLETLLYPKVSFYSDDLVLDGKVLSITGVLKFHGISLPLSTKVNYIKQKGFLVLEGDFNIQPSVFGIKLPSFMLVKMRDNIHISFHLELRTFAP